MAASASTKWKPSRPLEIVAGTPPGGGLDRAARSFAKAVNENRLADVPVSVLNVPGDGARRAWGHVDKFPADAHVVSISSPNLTTDKLVGLATFDQSDYTPLAILYTEYMVFIVRADSDIADAMDLTRRLGRDPKSVTISLSTTLGNPNHIALARVAEAAGCEITAPVIRVFDTALDVIDDVIAGNADVGDITAASIVKALAAGSVRPLAISSPERLSGVFAGVPTWKENGVDSVVGAWRGLTGPADLTDAQVAFWNELTRAATATDTWKQELAANHWTAMYVAGDPLAGQLERERSEYRALLAELGLLKESKPAVEATSRA